MGAGSAGGSAGDGMGAEVRADSAATRHMRGSPIRLEGTDSTKSSPDEIAALDDENSLTRSVSKRDERGGEGGGGQLRDWQGGEAWRLDTGRGGAWRSACESRGGVPASDKTVSRGSPQV